MKRFLSVLLVAILVVTSLSVVAFAATEVKTGDVKTFTVTVKGDEFCSYGVQLTADAGLKITKITGATGNVNNGKVSWASDSNTTSHSFEVTVEVTATEPGIYNVSASIMKASKSVDIEQDTEDGIADGLVRASVSANGASFEIVEPKPTEPEPTEPEPTKPEPTEPKPTDPTKPTEPDDPVVDMGDITPYGMYNAMIVMVVVAMASAVALVFKRKTAK